MTLYARVQFKELTTFQRLPSHKAVKEVEAIGVNAETSYLIEDDGPGHIKVSQGKKAIRVPWSNVVGAEPLVVEEPAVILVPSEDVPKGELFAPLPVEEPEGFPVLPRAGKPRKGILR